MASAAPAEEHLRPRLQLKPPSAATLARREEERQRSDSLLLLPGDMQLRWGVINSGTFGVIFSDGRQAMKVSIRGIDPSSTQQESEKEVTEAAVYKLAVRALSDLGRSRLCLARLLDCWGAGFLAQKGRSRSFLVLDLLRPDPALAPAELLLSVQLGQTDLSLSAGSLIEGPPAMVGGRNQSQGWRLMNGAVFARTVGQDLAEWALRDAGFLHGFLERFGLFLRDSEMVWAARGDEPARLYVLDFDKAVLDASPTDIARLRATDPVFPRPLGSTLTADVWGTVFWQGWTTGQNSAALAWQNQKPFPPPAAAQRLKNSCLPGQQDGRLREHLEGVVARDCSHGKSL